MGKAVLTRSVRTRCPDCGDMVTVRLVLGDKGEAITCPSCGGHVATMGELLDATIEQVVSILRSGLMRRGLMRRGPVAYAADRNEAECPLPGGVCALGMNTTGWKADMAAV